MGSSSLLAILFILLFGPLAHIKGIHDDFGTPDLDQDSAELALPNDCSSTPEVFGYSCARGSVLGDGFCNSESFLAIVAQLGQTQSQGLHKSDIIHQKPLFPDFSPMKPFAPQGFDWDFPGLQELDPRGLYQIENFLTPGESQDIMAKVLENPETVMSWHHVTHPEILKRACVFGKSERREVPTLTPSGIVKTIHERYLKLTGKPPETADDWFAHTYAPGGFISDHLDVSACERDAVLDGQGQRLPFPDGSVSECEDPSRRHITILTFLSDLPEEAGGATYFPKLGVRIQPKAGRTLVFFPTYLDKTTNPYLMHRGEDTSVPRSILQMWIRHGESELLQH